MKNRYILPLLAATLLATGCSKENGFGVEVADDEGQVLKSALDMSTTTDPTIVTRYESGVELSDFKINFIKVGDVQATKSVMYSEMPDVMTLKVGTYTATAEKGQDLNAEWENPYFKGASGEFTVNAQEITSYIDPIVCDLMNIKATIAFDGSLSSVMSSDSYVEVKVGNNPGLNFTTAEANAGKAGYFKHTSENTLVATFHGTVNGSVISETKTYDGIDKGRWYKLTFMLHQNTGGDPTGGAQGDVTVDANVTTVDVNADIVLEEDDPLDDSERPEWGGGEDPDVPPTPDKAPEILAVSPGMVFDTPWNVTAASECEFKIISHAEGGIQEFTCEIISQDLTPEELGSMNLPNVLDLVNEPAPDSQYPNYWNVLGNAPFNFPTNVGGQSEVIFRLTDFMGMMAVFGNHRHTFRFHVKDANGEVNKNLILQF